MKFSTANKILKGFNIPVQPMVVSKILKEVPDLEKMSELIQQDPCLTASVLKLVNQSAAAHSTQIECVDTAVHQLGVSGITAMLNVQLLRKAAIEDIQDKALSDFWKINNDVAFACSLMARQLNLPSVDEAHYLGLFHNIGMPLMWQKHKNYFQEISKDVSDLQPIPGILQVENNQFNCSHTSVGYYVVRGMSLSKNVCEAVRLHHDVARVFELKQIDRAVVLNLSLLKAAEYILGEISLLHGRDNQLEWQLIKTPILEELGLSELDFEDLEEIIKEETIMREGI